jgi:hypothetical protein
VNGLTLRIASSRAVLTSDKLALLILTGGDREAGKEEEDRSVEEGSRAVDEGAAEELRRSSLGAAAEVLFLAIS